MADSGFTRTLESKQTAFFAGNKEVLALNADGEVRIHGRKVKGVRDKDAWRAMQEFLGAKTSYGKRKSEGAP